MNWRPPAPKAGALPGCATPRYPFYIMKRRSVTRIDRFAYRSRERGAWSRENGKNRYSLLVIRYSLGTGILAPFYNLCPTFIKTLKFLINKKHPPPTPTLPLEGGGLGGGDSYWSRVRRAAYPAGSARENSFRFFPIGSLLEISEEAASIFPKPGHGD